MVTKKLARLDEKYFDNIDHQIKAYWLGLLFADGTVLPKHNRVSLGMKDVNHVIQYNSDLKSINKVSCLIQNDKPYAISQNTSKYLVNSLANLGCVANKTYQELSIPNIDVVFIPHFIRGFFDGDGCISINGEFCITCSSSQLLDQINQQLPVNCNLYKRKNKSYFDLKTKGMKKLRKIYNYLYLDANRYLMRKKEIWDDLLRI